MLALRKSLIGERSRGTYLDTASLVRLAHDYVQGTVSLIMDENGHIPRMKQTTIEV